MRRFFFVVVFLLATLGVALGALPWWFGGALRLAGQRWGVSFAQYERVGYGRFRVQDVRVDRGTSWVATARSVEAPALLPWLWSRLQGEETRAEVVDWAVQVTPGRGTPSVGPPLGWPALQRRLRERVEPVLRRLPAVASARGVVRWPGHQIQFADTHWEGGKLQTLATWDALPPLATVAHYEADVLRATFRATDPDLSADLRLRPETLEGKLRAWGNPAEVHAGFTEAAWWPGEARITADRWTVPAEAARLGELYQTLDGGFQAHWDGLNFAVALAVTAAPRKPDAPPVEARARLFGDFDQVRIEELAVQAPWATATLTSPVEFDRRGTIRSGPSQFRFRADLARLPWVVAAGQVEGSIAVPGGIGERPRLVFSLAGQQLEWRRVAIAAAQAEGELAWPKLELRKAAIDLGADGQVSGAGEIDLKQQSIAHATAEGVVSGRRLAEWLPDSFRVGRVTGRVSVEGDWHAPRHEGTVQGDAVQWAWVRPAAVQASWRGEGLKFSSTSATAVWGATQLAVAGAFDPDGMTVQAAELQRDGVLRWKLASPAAVAWRPVVALASLRLEGPSGTLQADWSPQAGKFVAALNEPVLDWLSDATTVVPPAALQVHRVAGRANWADGQPAEFSVEASGDYRFGGDRRVAARLQARSEGEVTVLEQLEFSDGTKTFAQARGRVPLTLMPGNEERWRLHASKPLELEAVTEPYREFWDRIAALTGARLVNPAGRLTVHGTLEKPEGVLELGADSASFEAKSGAARPTVDNLKVHAVAAADGITLDEFSFTVEGQRAEATGRLPLDAALWQRLARDPASFDWRRADVHLRINDAKLAPFAHYLPRLLAPQGQLTADLALKPGGELAGTVRITGAATRPLSSLGAVQDVSAEIEFKGWRADFRHVTAQIGGEPLALEGWVELPKDSPPRVNATLRGKNIPVARQPGLVVRSDLDLKVTTGEKGPTRLTGTLGLRDSLYVANLRSLVPGEKRAGPARPAPYFSIEVEPLNAWQLDVRVTGSRFLRVRTPLFRGLASAGFRLGGTLGNPVALGEARIDEGTVLFPFAGFAVDRGVISLTAERPRQPQLEVSGTSLRYGYDLRMELTGTPENPNVVFSSRPSLTSEQILLLVMAGESPARSDVLVTDNSNQQRFAQIGAYLGRNLFATFGGDPEAGDRLTVTTGARISRQGQETLEVEYELGRRWSLVGEYDEYDDYNVGLKYKVLRPNSNAAAK